MVSNSDVWSRGWVSSQPQAALGNVRNENPTTGEREQSYQPGRYMPSTAAPLRSSSFQSVWDTTELDQGIPTLITSFDRSLQFNESSRQRVEPSQATRDENPRQGRDSRLRPGSQPFDPSSYTSSDNFRMLTERSQHDNLEFRNRTGYAQPQTRYRQNQDNVSFGGYSGPSGQATTNGWNSQPRGGGLNIVSEDTRPTYQPLNTGRGQPSRGRQFYGDAAGQPFSAHNTQAPDWMAQPGFPLLQASYPHHVNRVAGHFRGPTPVQSQLEQFMDPVLREYIHADKKRADAYKLEDITGHVVSFCMQQTGSRFVQTQLVKAKAHERDAVFVEMFPELLRLSEDQSGNYVVQKIIECGTQLQKTTILEALKGKMGQLAQNNHGSRVVQALLKKILLGEQHIILDDMKPVISDLCQHENGQHVVCLALDTVEDPGQLAFIYDHVRGKVNELARDNHGCMVLQKMLEKGTEQDRDFIAAELRGSYQELCTHPKGNFVVQKVLEHCRPEAKKELVNVIIANVIPVAKTKSGSHVVEKLFEFGVSDEERRAIVTRIMADGPDGRPAYQDLCVHQFGNYVFKAILLELGSADRAWLAQVWQEVYGFLQVAKITEVKIKKAIDALIGVIHAFLSTMPSSPSQVDASSPAPTPSLTMEPNSPTSNSPSTNDSAVDEPVNMMFPFSTKKALEASPYANETKDKVLIHYK